MGFFILLDLFLVLSDLLILVTGHADAVRAGNLLLSGHFGILFLGIENGLGKILPCFLIFVPKFRNVNSMALAALLVMIGIFCMRFIVVLAGEYYPLI